MARINFDVEDDFRKKIYEKIEEEKTTIKDFCVDAIDKKLSGEYDKPPDVLDLEKRLSEALDELKASKVELDEKTAVIEEYKGIEHDKVRLEEDFERLKSDTSGMSIENKKLKEKLEIVESEKEELLYDFKNLNLEIQATQKELVNLMKADRILEKERSQKALVSDVEKDKKWWQFWK